MIKIDAMGDVCPLPVIKAKKALKENTEILVMVDNEIATQNLAKMAEQLTFEVKVEQKDAQVFQVAIFSDNPLMETQSFTPSRQEDSYVVVIDSKVMGKGNDELGYALMKGFIYSLTEQVTLPTHVIFYNGGAQFTTVESEVLDELTVLKKSKVEILTCGACLEYFELTKKIVVGEVTNMYRILELMSNFHVVKP